MKKFSLIIIFLICLFFANPINAENNVVNKTNLNNSVQEQFSEQKNQNFDEMHETIPEKNYENLKKIKNSFSNSKNINFFIVLISIGFLILLIYFFYRVYLKYNQRKYIVSSSPKETLESPRDLKSAINLFLGKTDE